MTLTTAILNQADMAGVLLMRSEVSPWASMTFSGARHSFDLLFDDPDFERAASRLETTLGEAEFDLPGALVADLAVSRPCKAQGGASCLRVEALTVTCA